MIKTLQKKRNKVKISNIDIFNKYLKDLSIRDKKEIIFILIDSFTETTESMPKQESAQQNHEKDDEKKFLKKNGYKYRELSSDLQWLNDHPIVLSEEVLNDERTRYIMNKCSK